MLLKQHDQRLARRRYPSRAKLADELADLAKVERGRVGQKPLCFGPESRQLANALARIYTAGGRIRAANHGVWGGTGGLKVPTATVMMGNPPFRRGEG